MKRFLCVLFSVLLLTGCFAACTDTADSNETPEMTEEQSAADEVTAEASDSYLEPTEEEMQRLMLGSLFDFVSDYDCEAEDAVERAYVSALGNDGFYYGYTDGRAFAESEFIESDEQDPRGLFYSETGDDYSYSKTPADSVDRFMREIMNVEPDHNLVSQDININNVDSVYYEDGYYYATRLYCGSGNGAEFDVYKQNVNDDGWDEVTFCLAENVLDEEGIPVKDENGEFVMKSVPEELAWTVTAKIVIIDGERYWSIRKVIFENAD